MMRSANQNLPVSSFSVLYRFHVVKVRQWRTSLNRIIGLLEDGFITIDPSSNCATNVFKYEALQKIIPSADNEQEFTLNFSGHKPLKFCCQYRAELLSALLEQQASYLQRDQQVYQASRLKRSGVYQNCLLALMPHAVVEKGPGGTRFREYKYINMDSIGSVEDDSGPLLIIRELGGIKLFQTPDADGIVARAVTFAGELGLDLRTVKGLTLKHVLEMKMERARAPTHPLVSHPVEKLTLRNAKPLLRVVELTADFIIEKEVGAAGRGELVSRRSLCSVYCLVRPFDDGRAVTIEYMDGSSRRYQSADRDALLADILEGCRLAGNFEAFLSAECGDCYAVVPRHAVAKVTGRPIVEAGVVAHAVSLEVWALKRLSKASPAQAQDQEVLTHEVLEQAREYISLVPFQGLSGGMPHDKAALHSGMSLLLSRLSCLLGPLHATNPTVEVLLEASVLSHALLRTLGSMGAFATFLELPVGQPVLKGLLTHQNVFLQYLGTVLLRRLIQRPSSSRNKEQEYVNKRVVFASHLSGGLCDALSGIVLSRHPLAAAEALQVIVLAVLEQNDTTAAEDSDRLLEMLGNEREAVLVGLTSGELSSGTGGDGVGLRAQAVALLLYRLAAVSPESAQRVQQAALRSAAVLYHFHRAVFGEAPLSRAVSRVLLQLWLQGPMESPQKALLRRLVPSGFLLFLSMPKLCKEERERMEDEEFEIFQFKSTGKFGKSVQLNGLETQGSSRQREMLFHMDQQIEQAQKLAVALQNLQEKEQEREKQQQEKIRQQQLKLQQQEQLQQQQQQQHRSQKQNQQQHQSKHQHKVECNQLQQLPGKSNGLQPPLKEGESRAATVETQQVHAPLLPSPSSAATFAPSSAFDEKKGLQNVSKPKKKEKGGKASVQHENFRVFFHMLLRDHNLPDLIWNQQTRQELRVALEAEIQTFKQELGKAGRGSLSWNHQHFFIRYSYAKDEIFVGSICLRLFLGAGDTFIQTLTEPKKIFDLLLRRALAEYHHDIPICRQCFAAMVKLYRVWWKTIGAVEDCKLFIPLLRSADDLPLQQYILQFIRVLVEQPTNAEQMLNESSVSTLVELACLCHTNPRQVASEISRTVIHKALEWSSSGQQNKQKETNLEAKPTPTKREAKTSQGSRRLAAKDKAGLRRKPTAPSPRKRESSNSKREPSNSNKKSGATSPPSGAVSKASVLRCWYVGQSRRGPMPSLSSAAMVEPGQEQGPYSMSELKQITDNGEITAETLVSPAAEDPYEEILVDKGIWKPVKDLLVLKNALLLDQEKAILTPAGAAVVSLEILLALVTVHESLDPYGVPYFPLPLGKRLLSRGLALSHLATCLLANDYTVVDAAARVIRETVAHNTGAVEQLYRTGLFYFALAYEGSNLMEISLLLSATHMKQRDGMLPPNKTESAFKMLLPEALYHLLDSRGASAFAQALQSNLSTPEIIWSTEMRVHLITTIYQHIGTFCLHLKENPMTTYNFLPIPRIRYNWLEQELFCSGYYLSNLCSPEHKDWEVLNPDTVLAAVLEKWREFIRKGNDSNSSAVTSALKVLGLDKDFTDADIKQSYRKLARKYHPDRNPQGREKFEEVQKSYETLIDSEFDASDDREARNDEWLSLILKSQEILYVRYRESVAQYKYPGYPMLGQLLKQFEEDWQKTSKAITELGILADASRLLVATCRANSGNTEEFALTQALIEAYKILHAAVKEVRDTNKVKADIKTILVPLIDALGQAAAFESARVELQSVCKELAVVLVSLLHWKIAMNEALILAAALGKSSLFQKQIVCAGVLWYSLPLMLSYDPTTESDLPCADGDSLSGVKNLTACYTVKMISSLGGFIEAWEDLKSPKNQYLQDALATLLTPSLCKMLRINQPTDLLVALSTNCATATRIWEVGMREELLDFVDSQLQERSLTVGIAGLRKDDLAAVGDFSFSRLKDEISVGSVYLKCFNSNPDCSDIEDTGDFLLALLDHLQQCLKKEKNAEGDCCIASLQALHHLVLLDRPSREALLSGEEGVVDTLIFLLSQGASGIDRVFLELSSYEAFSLMLVEKEHLWSLLKALVVTIKDDSKWDILLALCATTGVVMDMVNKGSALLVLGVITGHSSLSFHSFDARAKAADVIKTVLWEDHVGTLSQALFSRFLPEPLIQSLKNADSVSFLSLFDGNIESPEVVWNSTMRKELSDTLHPQIHLLLSIQDTSLPQYCPDKDLQVKYSFLEQDLFVGGVYLRRFLKEPGYTLKKPRDVLEKIAFLWSTETELQFSKYGNEQSLQSESSPNSALVVEGEDLLTLITNAIVFLLHSTAESYESLISWGWITKIILFLAQSSDNPALYSVRRSCVALLFELSRKEICIAPIVSCPENVTALIFQLLKSFPPESAAILEIIFNLVSAETTTKSLIMGILMKQDILSFLIEEVLESALFDNAVSESSHARVFATKILKIFEKDDQYGSVASEILNSHPKWKRYKNQNYSLFLSDKEQPSALLLMNQSPKNLKLALDHTEINENHPMEQKLVSEKQHKECIASKENTIPSHLTELLLEVTKGPDGLGIDLQNINGQLVVKSIRGGDDSGCYAMFEPHIQEGDVIWTVNGHAVNNFAKGIEMLKESESNLNISVLRATSVNQHK